MTTITTTQARNNLPRLLEQAHFRNQRIQIRRGQRPMAWLVGTTFMEKMERLIDHIITHDPALADTLVVEMDADVRHTIESGLAEVAAGKQVPLVTILDEPNQV